MMNANSVALLKSEASVLIFMEGANQFVFIMQHNYPF